MAVVVRGVEAQEEFGKVGRCWVMVGPVGPGGKSLGFILCGRVPHATEDFKEGVSIVYFCKD